MSDEDLVVTDALFRQMLQVEECMYLGKALVEFEHALIQHVHVPDVSQQ